MGDGTNPPSLRSSLSPTKQRGRATGTHLPKAIFRCPTLSRDHESSQKPSASQFHVDDDKERHWEALDSPAHGSVRTLSCKAVVALMSLALMERA